MRSPARRFVLRLSVFAALFLTGSAVLDNAALAVGYGTVSGSFNLFQNQGNFVATGLNTTDAKYIQAEYNTNVPAAVTNVYIADWNNWDAIYGIGATDANGNFSVSWTTCDVCATPAQFVVFWAAEDSSGRYNIRGANGEYSTLWVGPFILTDHANTDIGWWQWGDTTGNQVANVYDGAHKMWSRSLASSNLMVNTFTNLEVRFASTVCGTSCAIGASNLIDLDSNSAFTPQARIMHEMGHIATYKAQGWKQAGCYNFDPANPNSAASLDCSNPGNGWGYTTQEWAEASFEEGLATFLGDIAIYGPSAPAPLTCNSTFACTGPNVETTSCPSGATRMPITVDRYLRDVFDSVNEANDNLSRPEAEIIDNLHFYPAGTNDHQIDEVWNLTRSAIDARDGRSVSDFHFNYNNNESQNTSSIRTLNCSVL